LVGDAYEALAGTEIELFMTELINQPRPCAPSAGVEIALGCVDWFNNRGLHTAGADLAPAEYEQSTVDSQPSPRRGPN
jgi:hypothetical protein